MANTAQMTAPVAKTGETLTVGCKLPNGLWMQSFEMVERRYDRPDGTVRVVKEATERGGRIKLNGSARFRGGEREDSHQILSGAGLTFGVPVDAFNAWLEAHKDDEYVKNGLVFAHRSDTQGQAKAHAGIKTGFEPFDKANPPDEFKRHIAPA